MAGKKNIWICATLDTKKEEALYIAQQIMRFGHKSHIIDAGITCRSPGEAEITREDVLESAGVSLEALSRQETRGEAIDLMCRGLSKIVKKLCAAKELDAIIGLGGSGGATIAGRAMQALPVGVPKLILTTMACGNTAPYLQGMDIAMLNPIVDIQSLNFMSEHMLRQAAAAICAMAVSGQMARSGKRGIAVTCFGVTTPCVERCRKLLEAEGFEVVVFHARGAAGGQIMERMIEEDFFAAVLDVTTTEIADQIAGGIYPGGDNRLRTAGRKGIPYVVAPGALEMINLGTMDTLTPEQKQRTLYAHSPSSIKMRAEKQDMERFAREFASRLSGGKGRTKLIIPTVGFSSVNQPGGVFYQAEVNAAFTEAVRVEMDASVPVLLKNYHINDPAFARILTRELLALIDG